MKQLLALALAAALTAGCSAEPSRSDIAYRLYADCVVVSRPLPLPNNGADTKQYIEIVDKYCVEWAGTWLFELVDNQTELTPTEEFEFNKYRSKAITKLINEIVRVNPGAMK